MDAKEQHEKFSVLWVMILAAIAIPLCLQLPHFSVAILAGSVLLALPFLVLGIFLRIARDTPAAGSVVAVAIFMGCPWSISLFLMAWFKPGFYGAVVFGGLLGIFALLAALFVAWIKAVRQGPPGRSLRLRLSWLLVAILFFVVASAWAWMDRFEDQQACSQRTTRERLDSAGHRMANASLMQSNGFVPVCDHDLEPYELSGRRIDRWLSPPPAFSPVSLQSTPFAKYDQAYTITENISGVASRLYRGFRTPEGLQIVLMEHAMSADGGSISYLGDGLEETVRGAAARLTTMQSESGKAISLLSWQEGQRLYDLSVDLNVDRAGRRNWLVELAASLPAAPTAHDGKAAKGED